MSQDNLEVVRRGYEAFEGGDVGEMLARMHPDHITHRAPPQPDPGTWHGPEGLLEALADWTTDFDDFRVSVGSFIDANDTQVVVQQHQRAVGRASGVPIEADFWLVHTLDGGKVVRTDIYARRDQALEAVGLSE